MSLLLLTRAWVPLDHLVNPVAPVFDAAGRRRFFLLILILRSLSHACVLTG